jgi:hypothetical protein
VQKNSFTQNKELIIKIIAELKEVGLEPLHIIHGH